MWLRAKHSNGPKAGLQNSVQAISSKSTQRDKRDSRGMRQRRINTICNSDLDKSSLSAVNKTVADVVMKRPW
jgi:hypothetical protein